MGSDPLLPVAAGARTHCAGALILVGAGSAPLTFESAVPRWVSPHSGTDPLLLLSKQLVQLLFEIVVVEEIVQFHSGLHQVYHVFLVAFFQDVLVHGQGGFVHGAEGAQGVEHHGGAGVGQFGAVVQRGGTEFGDVGQDRGVDGFGEGFVVAQFVNGFGEDAVSSGCDASFGAVDGGFQAFFLEGIGAGHDEEVFVLASIGSGLDAVNHFFFGHNLFVRAVATTLLGNLVFNMHSRGAGALHFANGTANVEGTAPTGVDVDQQRHVRGGSNAANIFNHVVHGGHTQIRQTIGGVSDATTRQVNGLVPYPLRHHGGVSVDGTNDLQRLVFFQGLAETGTGGEFVSHGTLPLGSDC